MFHLRSKLRTCQFHATLSKLFLSYVLAYLLHLTMLAWGTLTRVQYLPSLMHAKGSSHLWVVRFMKVHSSKCSSFSGPVLYILKQLIVIHQNVLRRADGGVTLLLIFFLHSIIHTYHLISLIRIWHISLSWLPSSAQNHQHQTLGVFCVTNYYIIISL